MLETNLANVGPSVPPTLDAKAQAMARKKTEAWTDERIMTATAAFESSVANGSTTPPIKRKPLQKLALCIVLIQALWAIVVLIKNIGAVYYPSTCPDSTRTLAIPYNYEKEQALVFPGKDLVSLLNNVLEITLSNYAVQKELEASGTFDIDRIYNLISLEEFAVMSQYYALVLQSFEFPGATFTPRAFSPAVESERLSILLRRSTANGEIFGDIEIDLACSEENAFMKATRCTGSDGYPCPGDYPQDGETRNFQDVDLRALSNNTGLENNVGLLYMVDFFHQAMSTLFAAKDWSAALENLNYIQSVDDALDVGSLSGYKDNTPIVLEQDVFLVAVQAAQMETTSLSSCIASELVVGQFYTRTFILDLIQSALVEFDQYEGANTMIAVPSTTEAILQPVFAFNLHITSGTQFGTIQVEHTNFLKHIRVGSKTTVTAQLKLYHTFSSTTQVAGSSMHMLQNMAFFPEISSVFESKAMKDSNGEEYDCQNYKLIGGIASGINGFKDSSTGANTWMVYPLAEIASLAAPEDSWWDEEQEYASWFQTQEAEMKTAPFRVFSTHLNISSTARITPVDDNSETRCHRALFKVLGKIAYLALVELSKPASYLMFMSEVSVDHRAWLLNHAFAEELVGENFFGDRASFPYRSGAFTRKDDGSSWVVIPLLSAMIEHFGASDTLASILQELDRSFTSFVKASNGDLQFPDAASCHINGLDASTQTVTASDRVNEIYAKIYPGLDASVTDLLALVPEIYAAMGEAMASKRIYMISLTSAQILGNPVITQSTESFGAPYDWEPTALTAGMLKFWPPKTPLKATVQQLRDATRCYRMLELRYLNVTTRCFAEPNSVQVRRRTYESEAMRKFFLSNWSMAVMLNTMAWVIVLKYIEKLQKAWHVTKFECLDVEVALQLNFQGTGVLNISQSLLLLTATLPSLIGFHLPNDVAFTPNFKDEQLPKVTIDLLVTMSMSWFVKVGFEFCNNRISPKRPADWYYQFQFRWFTLMLIFVLRLITPTKNGSHDSSYQMWKLVFTCLISLFLGACNTCVIFLPERRGKVVAGDRKQGHDAVLAALVKQNLPLNRYGVLGRTSKGWSTTGLIVGGWKLARSENGERVLRKGAGEILLPNENDEGEEENSSTVKPHQEEFTSSEVEGAFEESKVPSPMNMCCVRAVLTQVVAILCVLAIILASYLSYEYYLKPWGEEQLAKAADRNIITGISCADCAGVNLEFPVSSSSLAAGGVSSSYSEFEVYLINNGGKFVLALASAGVAVGGGSLLVSLIATIAASSSSSANANSSRGSLGFEALLMISQGQFITLLGSLNLQGAPRFFYEFCKKFAWANLQFFPKETSSVATRALLAADISNGETTTVKGVQRYAQLVGVNADHLFYYTCLAVAAACAVIVVLYSLLRCCVQLCKKDHEALTNQLDNRVIWATILLLLVLQYILAMTSSFQIYYSITAHRATGGLVLAFFVLIGSCVGFVAFGMLKISRYSHELEDLGTESHEKRPFNHKYGTYYEDFTRENRYFFVAKIGLEIFSGCVVGIVQDPMYQIGSLVGLNAAFLVLVIARDPYLVRLFFYVCILSGYLRVTLLLLSTIQSSPDIFPQRTRNFVAELIIGLNTLLFMCLLVRQIYTMTRALYKWCHSSSSNDRFRESSSGGSRDASWRSSSRSDSRSDSRSSSSRAKQGKKKKKKRNDEYEARFTLQQLIASKIREDPPPVTPPMHGTPPSREPYQGNPSDRFV